MQGEICSIIYQHIRPYETYLQEIKLLVMDAGTQTSPEKDFDLKDLDSWIRTHDNRTKQHQQNVLS